MRHIVAIALAIVWIGTYRAGADEPIRIAVSARPLSAQFTDDGKQVAIAAAKDGIHEGWFRIYDLAKKAWCCPAILVEKTDVVISFVLSHDMEYVVTKSGTPIVDAFVRCAGFDPIDGEVRKYPVSKIVTDGNGNVWVPAIPGRKDKKSEIQIGGLRVIDVVGPGEIIAKELTGVRDLKSKIWRASTGMSVGSDFEFGYRVRDDRVVHDFDSAIFAPRGSGRRLILLKIGAMRQVVPQLFSLETGEAIADLEFPKNVDLVQPLSSATKKQAPADPLTKWITNCRLSNAVYFTADEKQIACVNGSRAFVFNAETGERIPPRPRAENTVQVAILSSIASIVDVAIPRTPALRNVLASSDRFAAEGAIHVAIGRLSDDDRWILASDTKATSRATTSQPMMIDPTGAKPVRIVPTAGLGSFVWSVDGAQLVSYDRSTDRRSLIVKLWDGAGGKPLGTPVRASHSITREERLFPADITWFDFSFPKQVVVTFGDEKHVKFWNMRDGKPLGDSIKHTAKGPPSLSVDRAKLVSIENDDVVVTELPRPIPKLKGK